MRNRRELATFARMAARLTVLAICGLGMLGAGCVSAPRAGSAAAAPVPTLARFPTGEGRIQYVADGVAVSIRHQFLHCDVPVIGETYFLNGAPTRPAGRTAHGAWIELEPGVNPVTLTRLRDGHVDLLDAKTIHYEINASDAYSLDPFGDTDGDGVLNGVFIPPEDTRLRIRYPLNGQIFR